MAWSRSFSLIETRRCERQRRLDLVPCLRIRKGDTVECVRFNFEILSCGGGPERCEL